MAASHSIPWAGLCLKSGVSTSYVDKGRWIYELVDRHRRNEAVPVVRFTY